MSRFFNKGRTAIVVAILATTLLSGANAAAAAPGVQGITVSPPLQQLTIGPGLLQANAAVKLTNNTSHDFKAQVTLVDFKALNQYGGVSLAQAGKPIAGYGLANWMSLPDGSGVSLAPGQSTTVPVIIQNRDDLTPGGHYGAVVVTASAGTAPGRSQKNTVGFNQELVSLLYLKKLGGDVYGLHLKSVSISGYSGGLPSAVTTLFASTGNVYVVPRGYIDVTDPTGKLVGKGVINATSEPVMQGSSEQLVTLMQSVADSGRPGRYKLTVYYRYDGASRFQSRSLYFTRGGWSAKSIVIIVFVGVILLLLLYILLQKLPGRQRNSRTQPPRSV